MNNQRRKQLNEVTNALESLRDDEQAAFDNMPESLQQGERGDQMTEVIGQIEQAIEALQSIQ